jgi:hypothetical protein
VGGTDETFGEAAMTDLEQEAAWRTEFEAHGERAVRDTIYHGPGIYPDPKTQLGSAASARHN